MKYRNTYFLFLFFLLACSNKKTSFSSESEFQDYLNNADNGFIKSNKSGDFIWDIKLIPTRTQDKNYEISFQLRISRVDGGSVLDYGEVSKSQAMIREGFLSFEIKDYVSIECNDQIIPCIFHHYERNYGLKPSVDIVFHFSNVVPKKDVYFVLRDELFHQGLIRIKFNKDFFIKYHVQK